MEFMLLVFCLYDKMLIYLLIKKKGLLLFSGKVAPCLGTCAEAVPLCGDEQQKWLIITRRLAAKRGREAGCPDFP